MYILYKTNSDYGKMVFALFFMPMVIAIINSQLEVAITLRSYGLVYWVIYSICMKTMSDLQKQTKRAIV
jgi:hypothetical protein